MRGRSYLTSLIYFAGMAMVLVGERVFGAGPGRSLTAIGVLFVAGALALRGLRMRAASTEGRSIERLLLGLYALGALSLLCYFAQSDLATHVFDKSLDATQPRFAVVLAALWPAVFIAAAAPIALVEMSYATVARAPKLEIGRIRDAMLSGFGLAGALVFAFAVTYVATARDKKADLSYFRTARPGESTRKIVRTLDKPVDVALFFPPANEVKEQVEDYFNDLRHESKLLEVHEYDHALDPQKARELGVSGNGIVVVARAGRREQLSVGTDLEAARTQLANLDREVQKRLLKVARPPHTVYIVTGHGERSFQPADATDKRLTIRDLRELLTQQSDTVRTLGLADGLGTDVPADASAVLLLGPQKPLLPEEVSSLERYFDRGGRLLIALDPDSGLQMKDLLGHLGLTFSTTTLANDQVYARRTYQLSDRTNIATGSYSSHPSVTTLGRLGMRAPMVLFGAGYFEDTKVRPKGLIEDVTVRSHRATFDDKNGNFTLDAPAEVRKPWSVAVAVTKRATKPESEGRAIALADSDALCDGVIGNPGNAYFVIDGVKWLLGEESITGEISSEVDVPIAHTHKQDQVWFYCTIFLAPALMLGLGFMVTRRRRTAGRKEAA